MITVACNNFTTVKREGARLVKPPSLGASLPPPAFYSLSAYSYDREEAEFAEHMTAFLDQVHKVESGGNDILRIFVGDALVGLTRHGSPQTSGRFAAWREAVLSAKSTETELIMIP